MCIATILIYLFIRRRWERSRNVTTTHIPVHAPMSSMHLMPGNGLLTSSLEYGIVARSLPLTGKILSGYLDASGSRAGLGVGNPNAEFTPNISACALASDGGTAKLVWGSRAGDMLFINVPRAMENGGRRSAAEVKKSSASDEHNGAVLDVTWIDVQVGWVITGGADARIKIWDAKDATNVWTSHPVLESLVPDPCIKVSGSARHGYVVCVFRSGAIHVWMGFNLSQPNFSFKNWKEIIIENPVRTTTDGYDPDIAHGIMSLHIDSSYNYPSILASYENDPYFYRINVDPSTLQIQITAFGDPSFGSTSTISPFFRSGTAQSDHDEDPSFIFVGDHLGCISLYAWDVDPQMVHPRTDAIAPLHKFEAHPDGASTTALAWNGLVLVAGSSRGNIQVFDGISFELLRSFPSPVPRGGARTTAHIVGGNEEQDRQRKEWGRARFILLGQERDVLFAGVGDRVIAWKAGSVPKHAHRKQGIRGKNASTLRSKKRDGAPRYLGTFSIIPQENLLTMNFSIGHGEMAQTILESQNLLYDEAGASLRTGRALGRVLDQQAGLVSLGLSEVEAVEYVLMLSRDEANDQARTEAAGGPSNTLANDIDAGAFEGDSEVDEGQDDSRFGVEDESSTSNISMRSLSSSSLDLAPSVSSSGRASTNTSPKNWGIGTSRPIPVAGRIVGTSTLSSSLSLFHSSSNQKLQVSPPYIPEPLEAGEWRENEDERRGGQEGGTRFTLEDFPSIGSGSKSDLSENPSEIKKNTADAGISSSDGRPAFAKAKSSESAWSTPLIRKLSSLTIPSNEEMNTNPSGPSSTSAPVSSQLQSNARDADLGSAGISNPSLASMFSPRRRATRDIETEQNDLQFAL